MRFRTLSRRSVRRSSLVGCGSSDGGGAAARSPRRPTTVIKADEGIAWDAKTYTATAVDGKVTISLDRTTRACPTTCTCSTADNVDVGIALERRGQGRRRTPVTSLAARHLSGDLHHPGPRQHEGDPDRHVDDRSLRPAIAWRLRP